MLRLRHRVEEGSGAVGWKSGEWWGSNQKKGGRAGRPVPRCWVSWRCQADSDACAFSSAALGRP